MFVIYFDIKWPLAHTHKYIFGYSRLVSLFYGILTFVGYFMSKKNSSSTINLSLGGIRVFIPFPSVLVRKWTKYRDWSSNPLRWLISTR